MKQLSISELNNQLDELKKHVSIVLDTITDVDEQFNIDSTGIRVDNWNNEVVITYINGKDLNVVIVRTHTVFGAIKHCLKTNRCKESDIIKAFKR